MKILFGIKSNFAYFFSCFIALGLTVTVALRFFGVMEKQIENDIFYLLGCVLVFLILPYIKSLKIGEAEIELIQNDEKRINESQKQNREISRNSEKKEEVDISDQVAHTKSKLQIADDPLKIRFGGSSVWNSRRLSAEIIPLKSVSLFQLIFRVYSLDKNRPLNGKVIFHLHPSFRPDVKEVAIMNGEATHKVIATGAFTIGAIVEEKEGRTFLELDLNSVNGGDKGFYS